MTQANCLLHERFWNLHRRIFTPPMEDIIAKMGIGETRYDFRALFILHRISASGLSTSFSFFLHFSVPL